MSSSKRAHRRRVAEQERQIRRHFLRGVKFLGADVPPLPARRERFGKFLVLPRGWKVRQA